MPISESARQWFRMKYGDDNNKTYSSKYYKKEESWPKIPVWWFIIPGHALNASIYKHVNLICQVAPSGAEFYYLKVPVKFLNDHFANFHQIKGEIDIYLSADSGSLFREKRGTAQLDFSQFLISG